jgi:hypothetical protein
MGSRDHAAFGYHIRAAEQGWTWVTYGADGQAQERGWAPQRALAAACVVRALARPPIRAAATRGAA